MKQIKTHFFKTVTDITEAVDAGIINEQNVDNFVETLKDFLLVCRKDIRIDNTRFGWIDDGKRALKRVTKLEMDQLEKTK